MIEMCLCVFKIINQRSIDIVVGQHHLLIESMESVFGLSWFALSRRFLNTKL